ncbi:MAG TPA: alanine--tRNA ligase-related protein [Streptosporangiaceae bacterium]|nr:alanine--tRNA ligase-related protein [Streptosporangiaceae bacterium]
MHSRQVIDTFIEFFRERGHRLIPGSSLVPRPGDPVLFTTSGMHPLTPYLEGQPHPGGGRLTGVQRCLRTTDLDEVGDLTHLTVFEMLGSWSLGDYPGEQSLRWGYELITSGFGIDPGRLHGTVFGGSDQVGPDTGLLEVWGELGVPVELTGMDNWWSNGPTGLCGTDSELFVWTGTTPPRGTPGTDGRWVEVWNHVMLGYERLGDGTLMPLSRPCVDTGLGLERLVMLLQGQDSVFGTDLLRPWTGTVSGLWPVGETPRRLVTDHLRSSVVVVGDGVTPSSTGRGYVLRRLVRRVLTTLWRDDPGRTLGDLPPGLIGETLGHFGQLTGPGQVMGVLLDEERRFRDLLSRGRQVLSRRRGSGPLTEEEFRYLHETHGLPREFVRAMLPE